MSIRLADRAPDCERGHRGAHIMHAHDVRAALYGQRSAAATLGARRSSTASPVAAPSADLRDQPTSSG